MHHGRCPDRRPVIYVATGAITFRCYDQMAVTTIGEAWAQAAMTRSDSHRLGACTGTLHSRLRCRTDRSARPPTVIFVDACSVRSGQDEVERITALPR
jgi:hypothetical protein